MEANRFDHLIRAVSDRGTRRSALGLLLSGSAGALGISTSSGKKKKHKDKKKGCHGSCPAGAICRDNVCAFCASGQRACGTTCVTTNDRANCGACGKACPAGAICQSGTCRFCDTGLTLCGNTCVNLATDGANCGRCGKTCPNGECVHGACACGPNIDCPSGCFCQASAQGGGGCVGADVVSTCTNYQCPLGQVCSAGTNNYCYAACPN